LKQWCAYAVGITMKAKMNFAQNALNSLNMQRRGWISVLSKRRNPLAASV
jgi:hypothetical protein